MQFDNNEIFVKGGSVICGPLCKQSLRFVSWILQEASHTAHALIVSLPCLNMAWCGK